jgi:hypothetical protein
MFSIKIISLQRVFFAMLVFFPPVELSSQESSGGFFICILKKRCKFVIDKEPRTMSQTKLLTVLAPWVELAVLLRGSCLFGFWGPFTFKEPRNEKRNLFLKESG